MEWERRLRGRELKSVISGVGEGGGGGEDVIAWIGMVGGGLRVLDLMMGGGGWSGWN